MPPRLKPAPLPPQSLRQQLGVPEGISDATLQDLLYAKQPQPKMEEMFSPTDLAPAAVRAGGLIGGGALAAGTGPVGLIGAGALNVFADQLASKMEALNRGEMLPDRANPARVASSFLSGAMFSQVPVPKGPLGYVTQGLANAGIQTGENLLSGQPVTEQGIGEAALMGTALHGGFQGASKVLGKVPMSVRSLFPAPVEGQRVPMTAETGAALIGGRREPTPNSMGFYSRLQNWSENLPDNASHNPLGLANQLQKGVTSKMELDETGVLPWLREQKGKVTTQQVRDYIDQHQIKVEEKMLGDAPRVSEATLQEHNEDVDGLLREARNWQDNGNLAMASHYFQLADEAEARFRQLSQHQSLEAKWNRPETLTPFEHGAEPNSYRELVMTMPTEKQSVQQQIDKLDEKIGKLHSAAKDRMQKEGFDPWKTLTTELPDDWKEINRLSDERNKLALYRDFNAKKESFTSSHYSDIPNPLVHMRFDSRIAPDGKKVLFIHEIQSDWHQKGREQGYKRPLTEAEKNEYSNIEKRIRELDEQDRAYGDVAWIKEMRRQGMDPNDIDPLLTERITTPERLQQQKERQRLIERQIQIDKAQREGIPPAPFKQTPEWTGLAAKRLLRYAAENGYDRVAWTPGEAQAERYDLSKHLSQIRWEKDQSGKFSIHADDHKGSEVITRHGLTEQDLRDHIGKEAADKLLEQSEQRKERGLSRGTLTGLDLKVGGEGMRGFYGSPEKGELGIVGGVMNDLGKKWGSKVDTSEIKAGRQRDSERIKQGDLEMRDIRHKVHSLDLPSSMKEEVKTKGQPIAGLLPTLLGRTEAQA
jgi:hypothetical protein